MRTAAKNRIPVTGGAGFIGAHLCDRLVERGAEVRYSCGRFAGRSLRCRHGGRPCFGPVANRLPGRPATVGSRAQVASRKRAELAHRTVNPGSWPSRAHRPRSQRSAAMLRSWCQVERRGSRTAWRPQRKLHECSFYDGALRRPRSRVRASGFEQAPFLRGIRPFTRNMNGGRHGMNAGSDSPAADRAESSRSADRKGRRSDLPEFSDVSLPQEQSMIPEAVLVIGPRSVERCVDTAVEQYPKHWPRVASRAKVATP
jgi:hypothetical protein